MTLGLLSHAADESPWVERLAKLVVPELGSLRLEIEGIDRELAGLSTIAGKQSTLQNGSGLFP